MSDCIFCKIVKLESPATMIHEDKHYLAFLDNFPKSEGHTLVIPKKHFRWVWDIPNVGEYFEFCRKVAARLSIEHQTDVVQAHIYGEQVPHAHVHLIPKIISNAPKK